ncbi:MAG: hypothetical protein DYH12_31995, partial [Sorangiineae bacterium PRO1]|nr:hypothetical protein [Sorangiineae bacterium PRO1]
MRIRASFLVVAVLTGLSACSSDESDGGGTSSSCASDPLSCGAGKTCWVISTSGSYDCIAATTDKPQGSPCQNTVGVAQCNEGLMCFPGQQGSPTGSCEPFCAKDGTCSGGAVCAQVSLINAPSAPVIRACAPTGSGGTGGMAGSGG